jgi:prephenate dehydrogenase
MKNWDTVAIVGVGLIGGSIGRDLLAQRLARRVIGIGRRAAGLKIARQIGACTETTTKLAAGVAEAQLVIVCTPVGRIVDDVRAVAAAAGGRKPGAGVLITDVGSTKGRIVRELASAPLPNDGLFIGSHPLAGSEKSGPAAAVEGLFQNRTVVVTPTDATPPTALRAIETFWKQLGARIVRMPPEEHDTALAATSHVPHVVASALAGTTPDQYLTLTAGGWNDSTRIAAADGPLWTQIFDQNRSAVVDGIARVELSLAAFRQAIEAGDEPAVERLLDAGRRIREAAAKKMKRK